jgi:hypothetical protein
VGKSPGLGAAKSPGSASAVSSRKSPGCGPSPGSGNQAHETPPPPPPLVSARSQEEEEAEEDEDTYGRRRGGMGGYGEVDLLGDDEHHFAARSWSSRSNAIEASLVGPSSSLRRMDGVVVGRGGGMVGGVRQVCNRRGRGKEELGGPEKCSEKSCLYSVFSLVIF